MLSYKELGKIFLKVLVICCLIFLFYGILKINSELPEVVRNYSGFQVAFEKNPSSINVKAGEYTIDISTKYFDNFFKGTGAIIDGMKNLIER